MRLASALRMFRIPLLIGLFMLSGIGSARGDYQTILGQDSSRGMSGAGWVDTILSGGVDILQLQNRTSDQLQDALLPQYSLFGPGSTSEGSMGGTGGSNSGSSAGPPVGLSAGAPSVSEESSGRLFLVYVCSLPPPFPSRLFHPPRASL